MPDLKLAPLLEAVAPKAIAATLAPFVGDVAEPPAVETSRLQAPVCYWVVYRVGSRRVTLKSFFSADEYAAYVSTLADYYPDRLDRPDHPDGGIVPLPGLNAILWGFPFDPAMPLLNRALDGQWIGQILRRRPPGLRGPEPLAPAVTSYNPEVGAVVAYREPTRNRVVAYGKVSPDATSGRLYLVMERLWQSEARRAGRLRLARPFAFRADAGLLLQAPVVGTPIGRERNRAVFLRLAEAAGPSLAAIHDAEIPFGPRRGIEELVARLESGLDEVALTSPALYLTLRRLTEQLAGRTARGRAEPSVFSHGDFKWDQFLEHRGRFALIDFELFCQAEPARDLGYFCAYLPPSRPRDWRDGVAVEQLRAAFLRSYAEAPIDFERVGLYEAAVLGIRALSHVWQLRSGWELRAGQLLDLAFERLLAPEPSPV